MSTTLHAAAVARYYHVSLDPPDLAATWFGTPRYAFGCASTARELLAMCRMREQVFSVRLGLALSTVGRV